MNVGACEEFWNQPPSTNTWLCYVLKTACVTGHTWVHSSNQHRFPCILPTLHTVVECRPSRHLETSTQAAPTLWPQPHCCNEHLHAHHIRDFHSTLGSVSVSLVLNLAKGARSCLEWLPSAHHQWHGRAPISRKLWGESVLESRDGKTDLNLDFGF